jgi:hypothetical protein
MIIDENSVEWNFVDAHNVMFPDDPIRTRPVRSRTPLSSSRAEYQGCMDPSNFTPEENELIRQHLAGYEI